MTTSTKTTAAKLLDKGASDMALTVARMNVGVWFPVAESGAQFRAMYGKGGKLIWETKA